MTHFPLDRSERRLEARRPACTWLAIVIVWASLLGSPGVVAAIPIDDFSVPFPSALSTLGTTTVTQPGIAVFGGTRTASVATFGVQPTGAEIIPNPGAPPATNVLSMVLGSDAGGRVEVEYPQAPPADLTLGAVGGSLIEIRSTLSVAGGEVIVELSDVSGTSASTHVASVDFNGPGELDHLFFLAPGSFPGIDFEQITHIAARVETTSGADFDLSNIELVELSPETIEWDEAVGLQSAEGFVNPAILVGFNPQPEPPPVVDLSDPLMAVITLSAFPPEPVKIAIGGYGTTEVAPALVVADGAVAITLTNAEMFDVSVGAMGPGGEPIDPTSLFGFNPQPEPPPGSLVGFNPQPEPPPDPSAVGFGFDFSAMGGGAAAAAAAEIDAVTITIEILDAEGVPVPLQQVQSPAVPLLGGPVWLVLAAGLSAVAAGALRRRG